MALYIDNAFLNDIMHVTQTVPLAAITTNPSIMMVRKHNGYEVGIWFFADRVTPKPVISSVWKRGRR